MFHTSFKVRLIMNDIMFCEHVKEDFISHDWQEVVEDAIMPGIDQINQINFGQFHFLVIVSIFTII